MNTPDLLNSDKEKAARRISQEVKCPVFDFFAYADGFSFTVETELQAYKAAYKYRYSLSVTVKYCPNVNRWSVSVFNGKDK